jgi:hypothetical protein
LNNNQKKKEKQHLTKKRKDAPFISLLDASLPFFSEVFVSALHDVEFGIRPFFIK